MRQPASSPAASNVILTLVAALPTEALRPLLLRLLLQNGAAAPRETSDVSRRPGWPKGKPRGPRKPASAAKADMAKPAGPDPKLAAQRLRDAAAKREKRRAAREGKANGANGAHGTGVAATSSATPPPEREDDRERRNRKMREHRARKAAARAHNSTAKAASDAAAKLWEHALELAPKTPWRAVRDAFNVNEAICLDAWRHREIPLGIGAEEVERFVAPPAN